MVAGSTGDNGRARAALLYGPTGLAVGASGNLYIAGSANHRVRKVSTSGTISLVAGTSAGLSGDNGPATTARSQDPSAVAVSGGTVYVADPGNSRIRASTGGVTTTVVSAGLNMPQDVVADNQGNLIISDFSNARIYVYAPVAGTFYHMAMASGSQNPVITAGCHSVAVDAGQHIDFGALQGVFVRAMDGTIFKVIDAVTFIGGSSGPDGVPPMNSAVGCAWSLNLNPFNGGLGMADPTAARVRFIN